MTAKINYEVTFRLATPRSGAEIMDQVAAMVGHGQHEFVREAVEGGLLVVGQMSNHVAARLIVTPADATGFAPVREYGAVRVAFHNWKPQTRGYAMATTEDEVWQRVNRFAATLENQLNAKTSP